MDITWFGHSAVRLDFDDTVLMIDPFLSDSPVFEGDVMEAAKGCTHIALTHGHDDHIGDTAAIAKETGATLIANFELCMHFAQKGVENYQPGNTGGTIDLGDFTLTFVQALHSSSSQTDHGAIYLGNPLGLIIRGGGHTVYHMGDTDVFGDMALINELYSPDIGIVPIGDRFTMGAKTAAFACKRYFNFRTILPVHYGTFPIIDQTADAFVAEMSSNAVVVAKIGESFSV